MTITLNFLFLKNLNLAKNSNLLFIIIIMKYLVCIDGSKESEKAISLCYRLVQEKDEVTVYGAYRKISHFGIETVDTEMLHALDVYHSRQEKARRAPIIQFLEEAKLKIQKKVKDTVQIFIEEVDDVRESIVAFAKRNEIDVIVSIFFF